MLAVKNSRIFGWAKVCMSTASVLVLASCMRLTPLPPVKPAAGMFSIYDGRPSTATERIGALNDCYTYINNLASNTPGFVTSLAQANQICMLQLGFRAPHGELPDRPASSWVAPRGACIYEPYMPVCWAVRYGWPQDPPPRWAKSGASELKIADVAGGCAVHYVEVPYPRYVAVIDKCMEQEHGYRLVRPDSPVVPWLPRKYWPNCKKPEAEMNWLEKKWCPVSRHYRRLLRQRPDELPPGIDR